MTTAIKERPILFLSTMVRAIIDGRKTQTRRIIKGAEVWPGDVYLAPYSNPHLACEAICG